ncbi:hypothetical protein GCM10010191_33650 [Actinomadura vinacea]|uniref:Uncharacterized protein n=1 Tax=Actinomadura vinacea TaxID=115336 RepID=A0ABN3J1F3_9ACTN
MSPEALQSARPEALRSVCTEHGGSAVLRGGAIRGSARFEAGVFGPLLRDLRDEQRVQDEQGRSVFGLEDTNPSAPATAYVEAISMKGGSGPHPWRRPV